MTLNVYFMQSGENFVECVAGEDDQKLGIVGTLRHYFYKGQYRGTSYTPRDTTISSFHARNNALENFLVRLAPGKETMLQTGDQIRFGYEQPSVYLELDYPDTDQKEIN